MMLEHKKVVKKIQKMRKSSFDNSIAVKERELIENVIKEKKLKLPLFVKKGDENAIRKEQLENEKITKFVLELDQNYEQCENSEKTGVILHELEHAIQKHSYYVESLVNELNERHRYYGMKSRELYEKYKSIGSFEGYGSRVATRTWQEFLDASQDESNYWKKIENYKTSNSYLKFSRYREKQADQIPAACGTWKDACAMENRKRMLFYLTEISERDHKRYSSFGAQKGSAKHTYF